MRIRYYIGPVTDLPHIYGHHVSEEEVEGILAKPLQDIRGRDDSRIAIGRTEGGRYLKVVYVFDVVPDSVFVITAYELGPKGEASSAAKAKEKVMTTKRYPRGWNEARVRKVLAHYESQTDGEAAAEIDSGLEGTTMEVPIALVPVVRELIASRKSAARNTKARKHRVAANKSRAA